jgi:DNA-binding PadR family transcriptional regulator
MLEEQIRELLKDKVGTWEREHASCASGFWAAGHGQGKHAGSGGPFNFGGGGAGGGSGGGFPPFPPFNGFPWNLFRRTRAKRGDVRAAILSLLAEKPLNGYQIMQELEQRSRGSWRPSPGAVYPALQQLEDEGLVQAETSSGGRTFSLTEQGRKYVHQHPDEFAAPWEAANQTTSDDSVLGLFAELKHIAAATIQVVHAGSGSQILEAQKILNQARRALYRLLADDEPEEPDQSDAE